MRCRHEAEEWAISVELGMVTQQAFVIGLIEGHCPVDNAFIYSPSQLVCYTTEGCCLC